MAAPRIRQVVIDASNARRLAEFYRELFGLRYRAGDEPPAAGESDPRGADYLVLRDPAADFSVSFQQVDDYHPPTWGLPDSPQQLHLDTTVADVDELRVQHRRVLDLGGRLMHDRIDDPDEPLRVYVDPDGHPFCIFVD